MDTLFSSLNYPWRILVIIAVAIGVHLAVIIIRAFGERLVTAMPKRSFAKVRSILGLLTRIAVFILYFATVGIVLKEFGVSLTAYLASASVLGLAVGFGSQGLVQDVVTGLTLIFSDLVDVDDMVEISGQTGIVQTIGMRFFASEKLSGS
jgi:small conductance mechanosensitive channel